MTPEVEILEYLKTYCFDRIMHQIDNEYQQGWNDAVKSIFRKINEVIEEKTHVQ